MCAIYTLEVKLTTPDGRSWSTVADMPAQSLPGGANDRFTAIVNEGDRLLDNLVREVIND